MKIRCLLFAVLVTTDYAVSQENDQTKSPDIKDVSSGIQLSDQKCEEYNKPIAEELAVISLIANAKPFKPNVTRCNVDAVSLIVGGTPAVPGEFPFMAALGWRDSKRDSNNELYWLCGGTLISEKFVLTAAHCLWSTSYGLPVLVRLGEHDLSKSNEEAVDVDVLRLIKHPDYLAPSKYNDIALIELNVTVKFTKWIRPACLWNKNEIEQSAAIATGWGWIDPADFRSGSNELLKVKLNLISNPQCAISYEEYNPKNLGEGIVDSMLCAGDLKGGRDTCKGDSGGPLFVTREGSQCMFHVVGITSFGRYCATKTPAVYTRVSSFVEWIEEVVWLPKNNR